MESKPLNNQINDDKNVEGKNEEENKENFQKDKYKKKGEYPNFLLKLYQILENESYKNIIHWTEDGKYFIISNLHDFTEQILPHYYKHNNYSSFIRQLNMYDFHKKKSGQNEHVFHHENFIRNRKDLLKLIKRKSKKENIPMNNQNNLIQLYNSNKYNKNNILDWKNNAINLEKHPLSIDDDINLNNSIHSLFSNNKNAQNKYLPQSSIFTNNINNNNINENYNKKLNDDILNNYKMENNEKKMKITKTNLQNLLTSLTHTIDNDIEKEKLLEAKIENLSKQNEEFMSQNKKILQEIISKKEYNQKLETVIRFIFEFLKPKSNNKYKTNSMNIKNLIEDDKNNQNGLINLSCQANDISDIISNKNYSSRNEGLDPFQDFLNKYLRYNKNGIIPNNKNNFMNQDFNYFYNYDKNTNNDSNINNVKTLRRNLLCSGKEEDNYKDPNKLINIKRKRSGSLSSILSDISKESKESKIIYNDNKAKNEGDKEEKIEEKKYEEENMTPNMNVISEVNNESFDSLNKSKNVFDIDFPQEENKSFNNNEFSQDLLNNSCTTFNYMYNSNLNNNSDVFSDVNK